MPSGGSRNWKTRSRTKATDMSASRTIFRNGEPLRECWVNVYDFGHGLEFGERHRTRMASGVAAASAQFPGRSLANYRIHVKPKGRT